MLHDWREEDHHPRGQRRWYQQHCYHLFTQRWPATVWTSKSKRRKLSIQPGQERHVNERLRALLCHEHELRQIQTIQISDGFDEIIEKISPQQSIQKSDEKAEEPEETIQKHWEDLRLQERGENTGWNQRWPTSYQAKKRSLRAYRRIKHCRAINLRSRAKINQNWDWRLWG